MYYTVTINISHQKSPLILWKIIILYRQWSNFVNLLLFIFSLYDSNIVFYEISLQLAYSSAFST